MKNQILTITLALLSLSSCRTESQHTIDSYELPTTKCPYAYDTINMVVDGLKQGVWINHTSHDTMVYLNDTGHSVTTMTTMEMILHLRKNGNKWVSALPDSFTVKSN